MGQALVTLSWVDEDSMGLVAGAVVGVLQVTRLAGMVQVTADFKEFVDIFLFNGF